MRRPARSFDLAFSFAAFGILCIVTGLCGYTLSRHSRFVAGTPWSSTVIWSQVWVGVAALPFAALFARRADHDARNRGRT